MKAEDLMIGDWVAIVKPDDFHGYNGQVKIINGITGYVTVNIPDMHDTDVLCDDLQPIPVTEEILEKNGLRKCSWYAGKNKTVTTYPIIGSCGCHIEVCKDGFSLVDSVDDTGDHGYESNWLCDVNNVHELQHAFKIFEIDKKIEL